MDSQLTATAPDFLFIDTILICFRLGHIKNEEQKMAMWAAARAANDAISFLTALENFGVGRKSGLHHFAAQVLANPAFYRANYPRVIGLWFKGEAIESFLKSDRPILLMQAVLTHKQQELFYDSYWWFVHQHEPIFYDAKKGQQIGIYANEPKDNASTLDRFEHYLYNLVNHKTVRVRQRFEGFPADTVIAILKRSFCQDDGASDKGL